jgi:hypothetical protein
MATVGFPEGGDGFYGAGYWVRRALWGGVPAQQRALDAANGRPLERLVRAWGDEVEGLIGAARALPDQRDAGTVRGDDVPGEWAYVTGIRREALPDGTGCWVLSGPADPADLPPSDPDVDPDSDPALVAAGMPWWPYPTHHSVGAGWTLRVPQPDVWRGAVPTVAPVPLAVRRVRWREEADLATYAAGRDHGGEVWATGALTLPFEMPPLGWGDLWVDCPVIGVGTGGRNPAVALPLLPCRLVAHPAGVAPAPVADATLIVQYVAVSGALVTLYDAVVDVDAWGARTGLLAPDDGFGLVDRTAPGGTVDYRTGAIAILAPPVAASIPAFNVPIRARYQVVGYYLPAGPPSLLDHLAADVGVVQDRQVPDLLQRRLVDRAVEAWGRKGSAEGLRIRAACAGFGGLAQALWRVDAGLLPATLTLDLPDPVDPLLPPVPYTTLPPRVLHFDDLAADNEYWDPAGAGAWVALVDAAPLYWDAGVPSDAQAFALDVAQGWQPAPVSDGDPSIRPVPTVAAVTALTAAEMITYALPGGYRVAVRMARVQAEAFAWTRGRWALTVTGTVAVPHVPGTMPVEADPLIWIDAEAAWALDVPNADPWLDSGLWEVVIGTGAGGVAPVAVGDTVAIRYLPPADDGGCAWCASYRILLTLDARPPFEAAEIWPTHVGVVAAADRLIAEVAARHIPAHARIGAAILASERAVELDGVGDLAGAIAAAAVEAGTFEHATAARIRVQARGQFAAALARTRVTVTVGGVAVLGPTDVTTGVDDDVTWRTVLAWSAPVAALVATLDPVWVTVGDGPVAPVRSDIRVTFEVTERLEV